MSDCIRIGIIGPSMIVDTIKQAIKGFPSFTPIYKVSDQIEDAPGFAMELMDKVDVLLFSGYTPYQLTKETVNITIPAHFIPLKGSSLYRALYQVKSQKASIRCLSVDTLLREEVLKVCESLGETIDQIELFEGKAYKQKEQAVMFHADNMLKGQCDAVLTGVKVVKEALLNLDVESVWVTPTEEDIIVSLERALLSTEKRREKESQIVFGIIQVEQFDRLIEKESSEQDIQRLKLNLNSRILDYVECLEGYLTSLNGNEYLFMTTRGIFERVTKGYKTIPLLNEIKREMKLSLMMGIGFGRSANEAGTNARLALKQCKDHGSNQCFIVREDRSVIGPVKMEQPMVYELAVTDQHLLEKAEKAGMTANYLSRLIAQIGRNGRLTYTAQEIAGIIGVTIRSTHRILLQWLDAGLIEIVGQEKITTKGRPRQIYRLFFIEEYMSAKNE
ncbi:hypothetical protein ACTWQL_04280 [Pseudalkalibacillus sp. R45]|uniref:hypothetical protein n=1 Tax=Pseudalkalibacillus sp. R45 TaxID=3457433 RepID=UPI003FCD9686